MFDRSARQNLPTDCRRVATEKKNALYFSLLCVWPGWRAVCVGADDQLEVSSVSCDLAASTPLPRSATNEARHDRFAGDLYGEGRSLTDAKDASFASTSGGFRALLQIARDTNDAMPTLLRTRPVVADRRPAEATREYAFYNSGHADRQERPAGFSNTSDTTASTSWNETSASAPWRTEERDPDQDGYDEDGLKEDEPGETDDDRATDTSRVIALPVALPVPSVVLASSASGDALTAGSAASGLPADGSIFPDSAADAAMPAADTANQTSKAPPPVASVHVQSVGDPVSSVPTHALLAGVVPSEAGANGTGTTASAQNGVAGNPAQNTAQHSAGAATGTAAQAAPVPAAEGAGTTATAGTGAGLLATAASPGLVATDGSFGGGMQDGQPGDRDARSPAIILDGNQDGNLALGDTEDSFAAVATPVTQSTPSARTAGSSTAATANPASPAAQVAQHLGNAAKSGLQRVEIALEPAALGHIDVRLDFGRDGRIAAHFIADTREALNALQADTRSLERALQDAGVQADAGSLGFSLRGETGGEHRSSFASQAATAAETRPHDMNELTPTPSSTHISVTVPDGRLDVRA